jgi:Zn-dependent protease with chaperone function
VAKKVVKLNPKAVVQDIRDGMDDEALGAKYGLSPVQLPKLFQMLVERGFIHQSVLEARAAHDGAKALSDNADEPLGSPTEALDPDGHESIARADILKDIPSSGSQIQEVEKSGPEPQECDKPQRNSEAHRVESSKPTTALSRQSFSRLAVLAGALLVAAVLWYGLFGMGGITGRQAQEGPQSQEEQIDSGLPSGGALSGQEEEDEGSDSPQAYCNWHVSVDSHGTLNTTLSLYGVKNIKSISDGEVTTALRDSLRCTLQDIRIRRHKQYFHVSADCRSPLQKKDFVFQGIIKPDPVRKCLEKLGPAKVKLFLVIPKLGYVRGPQQGRERPAYGSHASYLLELSTQPSAVPDVSFEFGYRTGDVIWMLAPLLLILTVPILLVLGIRKRTLKLAESDATAAWFGYWRVHRWIAEGVWLVWLVTLVCFHAETFVGFVFGIGHPSLYVALLFVPPGVVSFICQYLSRPVWLRVRGKRWDKREMLIRGFLEHAVAILPMAFLIIGITSVFRDTGKAMLWFAVALVVLLVGGWLRRKVTGTMPRTLHGGELKERVLELAQQAGVKINQVLLMPAQQYQMGNAFAVTGGRVMVTDYLLERLTKKETDSVMAHEIGHLKHHHTWLLSWPAFLFIFVIVNWLLSFAVHVIPSLVSLFTSFGTSSYARLFAIESWIDTYLLFPVSLLSASLFRYFISRRCERTADEFATLVTGDPESMITGLVKLSKMNLMPIRWGFWDESLGTHPSTMKRVEAIAKRHRIPEERVRILLETQPHRQDGQGYGIPDEVSNPHLVFSTEFKTQKALVNSLLLLLTAATTSLLIGHLVSDAGLPWPVYLAGFILMPVLYLAVFNYASLSGYGLLERKMKEKLEKAGIEPEAHESHFVGIAPEEHPRLYDHQAVWDVGFLVIEDTALTYYGDRLSFSVPRDKIISVTKGASFPSWFSIPETYIRWTNGDKEDVFHLHSVDGKSLTSIGKSSKALLARLTDWYQGSSAGSRASSGYSQPQLPAFPDVKGLHPRQAVTMGNFLTAFMLIAFLVFGLATVFQLESFISWYGLGMGAWCLSLGILPPLRYKEQS